MVSDPISKDFANRLHSEFDKKAWIIDTDTINHVTGDLSFLTKIKKVVACPVDLPDGQNIIATKEGTIHLYDNICLHHVLYVPKLKCYLILVSQFNDDNNYFVQFSSNLCAIYNLDSRERSERVRDVMICITFDGCQAPQQLSLLGLLWSSDISGNDTSLRK